MPNEVAAKPVDERQWRELSEAAWAVRGRALIIGKTKVGCALLSVEGKIYSGCNIEHRFRSHDIHAEVNAISSMVSDGSNRIKALLVVAERERFTPCGACMDWVMQVGGEDVIVAFQGVRGGPITQFTAHDLMPFYPA